MPARVAVLVVEDEALIRWDIVDFLGDEGFSVFEAARADEAIAILEANPHIRILFTDIDMPGRMDGLKLATMVRDRWPSIGVIVTSGKRAVALAELPKGGLFYAKPYDHAAIATSVRALSAASS